MNKNIVLVFIVMLAMGTGVWFYLDPGNKPQQMDYSAENTVTEKGKIIEQDVESPVVNDADRPYKEFVIEGKNYSFNPSVINVKVRDKVKIVLSVVEGFHDLNIDELGVSTRKISEGNSDSFEFIVDKVGSFEYYCSVGSHRALGMKGILSVEQ